MADKFMENPGFPTGIAEMVNDPKSVLGHVGNHSNGKSTIYPLVNIQKTMDNHHFSWVNQRYLWPFPIANC